MAGPTTWAFRRERTTSLCNIGLEERLRENLFKVELSISSYDTAWVAMVPSLDSSCRPCFPECLTWLQENQLPDGSWGLPGRHPLLLKDAISSTLACVVALKQWGLGDEHVKRGLHFIGSNFHSITDEKQQPPIGFNIIFPGMIEKAENLGLDIPLCPSIVSVMLHKRDLEVKRLLETNGKRGKYYLAYVSEGLNNLCNWEDIMQYQRKNGSLFNSPSTTAAALSHHWDFKCIEYLRSLLDMFGNAVPTGYPLDLHARLCMVDNVEKLGIARHFRDEIKSVLDETYRCWMQGEEEIHLDIYTCAMAFRLLRMNGYNISSDELFGTAEEDALSDFCGEHAKSMRTILELFKASQIMTSSDELGLEKLHSSSSQFLKQKLSDGVILMDESHNGVSDEVDYELKFPHYSNLERLYHRRNIERYKPCDYQILKTSYRSGSASKQTLLDFAVEDFKLCQSIQREELDRLERWVKANRLDQLNFARQKLSYSYFSAAATLFSPDLSHARIAWAKNGVLATVVDDFYDIGGSREELLNLIELVERWDGNTTSDCCSKQVEIIFSVLYNTMNEIGANAFAYQGRNVTHHLVEIVRSSILGIGVLTDRVGQWLALIKSMMRETEWLLDKYEPTLDEYMTNSYVSSALGPIVLPTLYLVGPKLPENVVRDTEYHELFKLMSTCGRLLNDLQGFKREANEGKLNSLSLRMLRDHNITMEEATREVSTLVDINRRELLKMVLQTKGSIVPRACKDLFWNMCKVLHLFYMRNDGFTSPKEMVSAVNAVVYEPLNLKPFENC